MDAFLASVITPTQAKAYAQDGYVTEVAPSGNEWIIYPVWAGGAIIRFKGNRLHAGRVRRACVHIATTGERLRGCCCVRCQAATRWSTLVPEVNIATIILYLRAGKEDYVLETAI